MFRFLNLVCFVVHSLLLFMRLRGEMPAAVVAVGAGLWLLTAALAINVYFGVVLLMGDMHPIVMAVLAGSLIIGNILDGVVTLANHDND